MLPFEPPHFGASATVGGAIAAGLAGPRRVAAGSVRDFVLGASLLDGRGDVLTFGGRVMKNVAGYDMARVLAGSLGTLGVLVDVSLKVLPRPVAERTLRFEIDEATAIRQLNEWGGQPLPISASAWLDGVLLAATVRRARGGRRGAGAARRQRRRRCRALVGRPARAAPPVLPVRHAACAVAAGGAADDAAAGAGRHADRMARRPALGVRRVRRDRAAMRGLAAVGGHATRFRGGDARIPAFQSLDPVLARLNARLKAEFDPAGIFNPGRLFPLALDMQTQLADWIRDTPEGKEADAILRKCVHCGFCTATCPTYQLLGDELDSPRGRIYLMKQMLEGGAVTAKTQLHLDRCLTCRSCETTCPSGVQYGRLVDIGRKLVDDRVDRARSPTRRCAPC